jgi:hypothetical protein
MRRVLLLFGGLLYAAPYQPPPDPFPALWAAFVEPMNEYIEGRNNYLERRDKLRAAIKAWKKMYDEENWKEIK